jgi:hypothetical protein
MITWLKSVIAGIARRQSPSKGDDLLLDCASFQRLPTVTLGESGCDRYDDPA